jgi:hypothetical protein
MVAETMYPVGETMQGFWPVGNGLFLSTTQFLIMTSQGLGVRATVGSNFNSCFLVALHHIMFAYYFQ